MAKRAGLIAAILLIGAGIFFWAYREGAARESYSLMVLEKSVPVPIIYNHVEGHGELDGSLIHVDWWAKTLPEKRSSPYFICMGKIRPVEQTYYVLELDGRFYLEESQFIEPIFRAMYHLHRGADDRPEPATARDVLRLLPDDPRALIDLATRIKAVPLPDR